jgi:hypothetical protein
VGIDFCFVRVSWVGLGWVGFGFGFVLFGKFTLPNTGVGFVCWFVGSLHCVGGRMGGSLESKGWDLWISLVVISNPAHMFELFNCALSHSVQSKSN